jgi:hypothetical protein
MQESSMMLGHHGVYNFSKSIKSFLFILNRCGIKLPWQQNPGHISFEVWDTASVLAKGHQAFLLELVDGVLQLRFLFWSQVINGDIHDIVNVRHLESARRSHRACQKV